jgi:hypothetical protein
MVDVDEHDNVSWVFMMRMTMYGELLMRMTVYGELLMRMAMYGELLTRMMDVGVRSNDGMWWMLTRMTIYGGC